MGGGLAVSVLPPFFPAWPIKGYPLSVLPHMPRRCLWMAPIFCPHLWKGDYPEAALSSPRHCRQHRLMKPAVWYLLYLSLLPGVTWSSPQAWLSLCFSSEHITGLQSSVRVAAHLPPASWHAAITSFPLCREALAITVCLRPSGYQLSSFWKVPDSAGIFFLAAAGQLGCGPL